MFVYVVFLVCFLIGLGTADDYNAVIDLKFLNRNVDFVKVKNSGVKGVLHMITQGVDFKDPTYQVRKKEALDTELLWGAYHISDGSPGHEQALFFLDSVGNDSSILLAIGIEKSNYSITLKEAEDFVETVYRKTDRYPLIYGHEYLAELVRDHTDSVLTKCGLWMFQYEEEIIVLNGWKNWTLWQYTDGVNGPEPHGVNGVGPCGRDRMNMALHKNIESLWNL